MSAPLVKTRTPGIYKRGERYVVIYRDPQGKQRKQAARTLAEAREVKAALTADVKRGEYRILSRVSFIDYAPEWLATYTGRTSRGIRPETLDDYRRDLGFDRDGNVLTDEAGRILAGTAVASFGRMHLTAIEPRDVKRYVTGLAERGLSPGSVRNALAPVRALFATAFEEGLIRTNPAAGLRITQQVQDNGEEPKAKALTEDEIRTFLDTLSADPLEKGWASWRLFFEFLAHSGLRIGEAVALTWGDVDFGQRRLQVRRRLYRGRIDAPKSRYGKRTVPLAEGVCRALWTLRGTLPDEALVFPSMTGSHLDASNLMARVLKPAAVEAGLGQWVYKAGRRRAVTWVGFHTFRHTAATMLFRNGLNAKQVQVWLGHHSPAFTLATYVHLMPDDLPDPGFLDTITAAGATAVATRPTENDREAALFPTSETVELPAVPRHAEIAAASS